MHSVSQSVFTTDGITLFVWQKPPIGSCRYRLQAHGQSINRSRASKCKTMGMGPALQGSGSLGHHATYITPRLSHTLTLPPVAQHLYSPPKEALALFPDRSVHL